MKPIRTGMKGVWFMFKKRFLLTAFVGLISSSAFSPAEGASYKLIVHPSNGVGSMTAERASALFLKKVGKWDNGRTVLPVDLLPGSAVREEFSRAVHGKSVSAVKSFWQQQIFSGRDVPPPEKSSDREVLAYVEANPGGIGYVSAGASVNGVKVIQITR